MGNFRKKSITLLAALLLVTMGGCSSTKESVLQDTILYKAVVGTIDGEFACVRYRDSRAGINGTGEGSYTPVHDHYFDIVNGEWITDFKECINYKVRKCNSVEVTDAIINYLTEEEFARAMNNSLSNEDIVSIIFRIKQSEKDNQLIL